MTTLTRREFLKTSGALVVSFAAPPILPTLEDPSTAPACATAKKAMQRSVTASRRVLLNIPPVRVPCVRALPRPPSVIRIVGDIQTHVKKRSTPFGAPKKGPTGVGPFWFF